MFNSNTINVSKEEKKNKGEEDYCNKYKGIYSLVIDEKVFIAKLEFLDTFAVFIIPATLM